ncbi:MAG: DNA polymerase III subunit epsilon, partial [Pseudomonas sp.]|nr:DNA polymerase III subunit epsilon [Pseudomonas sp.]
QLQILRATDAELQGHEARLDALEKSAGFAFWRGAPEQS